MSTAPPEPLRSPHAEHATFGKLLRQFRLAAGLSQEALAERAGMSVQGLSLLENGKRQAPYRSTVALLAQAMGLSPDETARLETVVVRSRIPAGTATVPFPIMSSAPAPKTNLPVQLTSFVGREREMVEVTDLLESTRLLTLAGTGGVGKTRLALAVAEGLLDAYPAGVWLAELAPLVDPALVPGAVLAALRVPEQPGRPPLVTLLEALRSQHLLLVLDNCEHLLDGCARLVEALLQACPRLRILATSREPLGLLGETRWRVPSLSLPATDEHALPASVAQCEAVQLFLERGRAVQPQFALSPANASVVAGVCRRLDGIPLALELAAARLSALGVADLYARLDQRFRMLTGGSPTALPRQQTLRATVEWSYALLTAQEQTLFARLCVFAGVWSLEGAEVVGAGGAIAAADVLELLVRLVDRSLVLAEETDEGNTRYRLLETLRQYGRERLTAAGETALVQRRHAAYYLALVERAEPELTGPEQLRWLDLLEREHDNLRVALAWCLDGSEQPLEEDDALVGETGMRLAAFLHWFWLYRDHNAEGLAWLERALARGAAAPAAMRAQALYCAGVQAGRVNDRARSQALLTQAVALCREVGDGRQLSVALGVLGWATWIGGQEEQAAAVLEESLAMARVVGEPWPIAHALMHCLFRVANSAAIGRAAERARARAAGEESLQLFQVTGDRMCIAVVQLRLGQIALYEGDYERARTAFVACLPGLRVQGGRSFFADGVVRLADVAREQGDYGEATTLYAEGLAVYRELGDQWLPAIAWVLSRLAAIALEQGEWTAAHDHLVESLDIALATGHVGAPERAPELASALEVGAALAAVLSAPDRAVRLAGAAAALRAHLNWPAAAAAQATLERRLTPARQALSTSEQATAWAEGQVMTPEQAIAYALAGLPAAHGTAPRLAGADEDDAGREQALRTPQSAPPGTVDPENAPPPPRVVTAAASGPRLSRTQRQAWAVAHLRAAGPLSPRAYARALAVSVDTALRDLQELVDRGVVQAAGTTRDRRYVLAGEDVRAALHRIAH